jgi:hypothetical protein
MQGLLARLQQRAVVLGELLHLDDERRPLVRHGALEVLEGDLVLAVGDAVILTERDNNDRKISLCKSPMNDSQWQCRMTVSHWARDLVPARARRPRLEELRRGAG